MRKLLFLTVILMTTMSSCAAPVETTVPTTEVISIPTETPTPTVTPTIEPAQTSTAIPAPTLVPDYTELGEVANRVAKVLGWGVVPCDSTVTEEDWERGIFFYREDTNEYFCDFTGFSSEPFPEPSEWESIGIYRELVFSLYEIKGTIDIHKKRYKTTHGFMVYDLSEKYFIPFPSTLTADDYIRLSSEGVNNTLSEYRLVAETYWVPLVMWPLTEDEYRKILEDSFFDTNVRYLFSPKW